MRLRKVGVTKLENVVFSGPIFKTMTCRTY